LGNGFPTNLFGGTAFPRIRLGYTTVFGAEMFFCSSFSCIYDMLKANKANTKD